MLEASIAVVAIDQQMETVMLKYLSIFTALFALGAGPLYAQEQEAVLQTVEVPGAGFNFVVATPHPEGGALPDLANTPEALIVHLHGGMLALVFDDPSEMVKAFDSLITPVCAFETAGRGGSAPQPLALYIVPKGRATAMSRQTTTDVQWVGNERWPALMPNPGH